jgi:hypothetical protein
MPEHFRLTWQIVKTVFLMAFVVSFTFRDKIYEGEFFIDSSPFPGFLFVVLTDKSLIKEFGTDVTIKTDGSNRLVRKDDYPELAALRQILFDAIKTTPALRLNAGRDLAEDASNHHCK